MLQEFLNIQACGHLLWSEGGVVAAYRKYRTAWTDSDESVWNMPAWAIAIAATFWSYCVSSSRLV